MDAIMRKTHRYNYHLPFEYIGEVNTQGQPDGFGAACFNDGTFYKG